jgi:hypothetical protein
MKRPALAVNPAVARPAVNPMAAMAAAPQGMPGMKKGGETMKSDSKEDTKMDMAQDKAMIKKAMKQHDMQEHKGGKGTKLSLCKGGKAMKYSDGGRLQSKGEHPVQKQSKRGAMVVKMASGGYTKSADGIAVRGKTKGKMC